MGNKWRDPQLRKTGLPSRRAPNGDQKLEAPGRGGSSSRGPITPCDEGVTYGVLNGHWSGQRPMSLVQVED
jgi:hypothetical protein